MNKEFEKIIEKLEEKHEQYINTYGIVGGNPSAFAVNECIDTVREIAEQYSTKNCSECSRRKFYQIGYAEGKKDRGWIPCSERLPEDDSFCIVTVEYPNNKTMVDYGWFDRKGVCWFVGMQEFRTSNILAWQPLPQPYQPN